ncbi:hypothetical protein JR316_0006204 [Psilocybe cubensis]|uniref:Uncharacterized protein n=2 Tax=Psilocybe cubensis TaxID=181762 RepID=A0ACB8H212_PSICU|nr:hypothetical protein JR316_0006204 [Psilocybe cubensis]KAH9481677.1 hypothetical protein JR316_0006204 [Psilocybe cubensis]
MSFVKGPYSYKVLLLNTDTNLTLQVGYTGILPAAIQICLPYIIFMSESNKGTKIKVQVRELPKELFSNTMVEYKPYQDDSDIPWANWHSSVVDYESDTQPADSIRVERVENMDSSSELKSITVLARRCSWNGTANLEQMAVFHFPVDTSRRNVHITEWPATYTFSIPSLNGTWHNFMGSTGRRTVCFSQQRVNNRTEEVLMKASLPKNDSMAPIVHRLLVPEMDLPFDPHQCSRIYLEEATGRLFVTLKTGGAYLLELGPINHL